MVNTNFTAIVDALESTGLSDHFTPEVSRFVVHLLRRLADGQPVAVQEAQQLASSLQVSPDVASEVIEQMAERDKAGNIVGLMGLSQQSHAHKFHVNGHTLSTWCALDALFLPILLDQTAEVIDQCPATKAPIQLTVTPTGVTHYHPESTVVSVVTPQTTVGQLASVEEIWMTFCHYIHFFRSMDAAQQWFATRPQAAHFLSVEDAFELGRTLFAPVAAYVAE